MSDDKVKDEVKEIKPKAAAPKAKADKPAEKKKVNPCDECPKAYGSAVCWSCVEYKENK